MYIPQLKLLFFWIWKERKTLRNKFASGPIFSLVVSDHQLFEQFYNFSHNVHGSAFEDRNVIRICDKWNIVLSLVAFIAACCCCGSGIWSLSLCQYADATPQCTAVLQRVAYFHKLLVKPNSWQTLSSTTTILTKLSLPRKQSFLLLYGIPRLGFRVRCLFHVLHLELIH